MDISKAEKKGRVFQCSICDYKQIKKYAIKHYLKTHVTRHQVPFSCSKCDYVSLTLKDVENHGKWYGPHKNTDLPVDIVRAADPFVWKDDHLKRWDQPSSLAHWMNQQKKNDEKSLQNLLEVAASLPNILNIESTESTGIVTPEPEVPPFEDILPDLLGVGESVEIDKPEKEDTPTTVFEQIKEEIRKQGERQVRALQEQTKAIQELNKTLTGYFYNSGPQRGLTPLPDRPPTPVISRNQRRSPRRPTNHFYRPRVVVRPHRPMPPRNRDIQRDDRWKRSRTLFTRERSRSRSRSSSPPPKKMKSVVKKST